MKPKPSQVKNWSNNFIWVLIILMVISAAYSLLGGGLQQKKELSLSELVAKINSEEVAEIRVIDSSLEIKLKNGEEFLAHKEPETGLTETLKNYGVEPDKLGKVNLNVVSRSGFNFFMGVILPIIVPVIIIALFIWMTARQVQRGSAQAFTFGQSRARLISPDNTKERITFKDVAGVKEAKEELKEIVDFLKNPKKFLEIGAKIPKGVLLMGAPGTGKTMLAKAVSGEAGVPFFHMSASEFIEMFVGVGASRTRDLFRLAKKSAPSIIFIDELDAIGRIRGAGLGGGHDEREQTLNQILVEMDGMETDDRVIVMSASVTGDTPVLVKKNEKVELLPIETVIDAYYQNTQETGEKNTPDLEVLGFEKRPRRSLSYRSQNLTGLYFDKAVFKSVRSVFRHKVNTIYEINYVGGKIRATGNHSVFVRNSSGLTTKAVSQLKKDDILVDIPYVANRTRPDLRELRSFTPEKQFNMELPLWQPLFAQFGSIDHAYQYALAKTGIISQTVLGKELGFSQRTIGKWQQQICKPRELSKNYYQYKELLPEKILVTPELARLLGYYVAEGYARKEVDFCLNIKEKEEIKDIENLMKEIFNLEPNQERHITPNAVNIIYYCKPLAEFFKYHCGKGAYNKHIPQFLWTAPSQYFVEFLRGYTNGDGYKDKRGRLMATSVSKQLILELNWLARMHGFKSHINSFVTKEGRRIKNGKPLSATTAWRIGFGAGQNPLENVNRRTAFKRAVVQKITKISHDGFVYDFCGCDNEAFFGGTSPVLLHNTNRPDVLDPALLRPGRFDRRVILDLPDINDREEILKIHAKNKPLEKEVELRRIAERTPGFSGADLANLINEAAIVAAREDRKKVGQMDLINSIEKVILGPERKSHILSQEEKKISAYHEAGHALVAASMKHADPVHKVSIVSRGRAAGYTLKLPLEDRHLYSRSHFRAELAVSLGGYAAEKLVFDEITTGASDDIRKATALARNLVTRFGMSEKVGPIALGEKEEMVFLGRELTTERNYSEDTAKLIDKEVKSLIDEAYEKAVSILTERRNKLDDIANTLIEKETLEKEAFEKLVRA